MSKLIDRFVLQQLTIKLSEKQADAYISFGLSLAYEAADIGMVTFQVILDLSASFDTSDFDNAPEAFLLKLMRLKRSN